MQIRRPARCRLLPSAAPDEAVPEIALREEHRDVALRHLDAEAARLRARLEELERARLLEKLACFKDVLALYRTARRARR